jgi:MFS family permease
MENPRWKEFEMRVEAYRYYLSIILQTNVFFYAIAGAAIGFYLNRTSNEHLVYALLLPILIAAVLGGIFHHAAVLQKDAAETIEEIRTALNNDWKEGLGIKEIPDLDLLYILLRIFGWIFFLVGLAIIATPSLKAYPFQSGQYPANLILFTAIGCLILVVGGGGSYWLAYKHHKKAKNLRKAKLTEQPKI